ncbi:MAG: hypothetical protein QHH15_08235 [Candidatus Thermoplasmatota archaeon]|nr:hypothetical protein [Candidatus Thermoplasmatota archaeon]
MGGIFIKIKERKLSKKIWNKLKEAIDESREKIEQKNIIYVTEACFECPLRSYYRRKFGEEFDDKAYWNISRGKIFDEYLTEFFDDKQVPVQCRIKDTAIVVRGKIDGVFYDPPEVWEIKTVASVRRLKEPYPIHKKQALFYQYNWNPMAKTYIWYISMDGYKVFEIWGENSVVEEMIENSKSLYEGLVNNVEPKPKKSNECYFCKHKETRCCLFNENNGRGKK